MDKLKEQEYLFAHKLEQEKLKSAEQSLEHRLVYTGIIFVIILIILSVQLEGVSSWVQWLLLIIFFGVAAIVFSSIWRSYEREKTEARK